jgi:hypothetical protein
MAVELDHVFICTNRLAPEAALLVEFGLSEGASNTHPGQGTANRRFFFENAFLEFLWVDDPPDAQSDLVARTGLWERWSRRESEASPFGVGLRFNAAAGEPLPFASWDYRPPYLPAPLAIQMAEHADVFATPLLFALGFGRRPDGYPPERRQRLDHSCGVRQMTHVRIRVPQLDPVIAADWLAVSQCCPMIEVVEGWHLMEIEFDHQRREKQHDLRPDLPLVFRW